MALKLHKLNPVFKYFLLLGSLFLAACDFSPRLYKEIFTAQQYIQQQKYSLALKKYEEILTQNPPVLVKIKVYYQMGELYSTYLANHRQGLEYFKKIKEVTEDPLWLVQAEEKMAEINFTYLKDFEQSMQSYTTLANFLPKLNKLDFYEFRLALSYQGQGRYAEAKKLLQQIAYRPGHEFHVAALYQLGLLSFENKQWKDAIKYWKEYNQQETRKDSIVATKFLMANAYETMEDLENAYNLYYSILGEYPNPEVVKNRLNAIYNRKVARKR